MKKVDFRALARRLKAIRSLAGLSVEQFSKKYNIPRATIQKTELALHETRKATIDTIVKSYKLEGVELSKEWLLYGNKSQGTLWETEAALPSSNEYEDELIFYEKKYKKKGLKIASTLVLNNDMSPDAQSGDFLLGPIMNEKQQELFKLEGKKKMCLIGSEGSFFPAWLISNGTTLSYFTNASGKLIKVNKKSIAIVKHWNR